MRKRFLFLAAWCLAAMTAGATDYMVSGAGSAEFNGTYVESGTYGEDAKPLYIYGDYRLGYQGDQWLIANEMDFMEGIGSYCCFSESDLPPAAGWETSMGMDPAPTVGVAGPTLSYDGDKFIESIASDGTISNALVVTYSMPEGDSFSGSYGVFDPAKYTVANVPDGLTLQITKNSGTELGVSLSGAAVEHIIANNVTNLTIAFLNSAFTLGDASAVSHATKSDLGISFRSRDEFQVNTYTESDQVMSSVAALAGGGFVVAWASIFQDGAELGVYAQRYNADGTPVGGEFQVNTYTSNRQQNPSVAALTAGGFVVAWESDGQDGSGDGIYAQRYNADGTPVGGEFQVNTYTTSFQTDPSVAALAAGGFVVAWTSYGQDGSLYGIYAQRYDTAGTPAGSEFRVNTYTTSYQQFPSVAALATGGFVVAWQSNGQDGDETGIYAQRYDAAGAAAGSEFRVNTYTTDSQMYTSVAALTNGGFVVTWQSTGQDGSGDGIYAQRYDDAGIPAGSEIRVNTYTTNDQLSPSVAALAAGGFVVAWTSYGQDGSGDWIYAQRYNAAGTPEGSEFRVNTYTTNDQQSPSVATFAAGGFVVAWESDGQDGSSYGIFAGISTPLYSRGSATTLEVAQDAGAAAIDALLHAYDLDHNDLTWSVSQAPAHGSLAGFPDTQSGTTVLAPAGTTYQPTAGYAGADSFTIAVTDGETTSEITVTVNVVGPFTVFASAGPNGTVTPAGNVMVAPGTPPTNFVATADAYYHIASFLTNDSAIAEAAGLGIYTSVWANVVADGTVTVAFAADMTESHPTPLWWLAQYGWTSDFEVAVTNDTDADGFAAWQEYVADTIPTNTESKLTLTSIGMIGGATNCVLSWPGVPGRVYDVECTTNLATGGPWDVLSGASGLPGVSPANTVTDAPPASAMFYRVKVRLP